MFLAACGGGKPTPAPTPVTAPLPTAGIAGQQVAVYPLTLLTADEALGWETTLLPRRVALDRADSLLGALLSERSPEVSWLKPDFLRRQASKAPGLLTNPDQMATALLRSNLASVPDPLRSQMRNLSGVAGGRYALVPAALFFVKPPAARGVGAPPPEGGQAELILCLVDVRTGIIGWRTVARGTGPDPWTALRVAVKSLVPGMP